MFFCFRLEIVFLFIRRRYNPQDLLACVCDACDRGDGLAASALVSRRGKSRPPSRPPKWDDSLFSHFTGIELVSYRCRIDVILVGVKLPDKKSFLVVGFSFFVSTVF